MTTQVDQDDVADIVAGLVRAAMNFCDRMGERGLFADGTGKALEPALLGDGLRCGAIKLRVSVTLQVDDSGGHVARAEVEALTGDGKPPVRLLAVMGAMAEEKRTVN